MVTYMSESCMFIRTSDGTTNLFIFDMETVTKVVEDVLIMSSIYGAASY